MPRPTLIKESGLVTGYLQRWSGSDFLRLLAIIVLAAVSGLGLRNLAGIILWCVLIITVPVTIGLTIRRHVWMYSAVYNVIVTTTPVLYSYVWPSRMSFDDHDNGTLKILAIGLVFAIAFAFLAIPVSHMKRLAQQDTSKCVSCGYDLTGNVSGVCPECGTRLLRVTGKREQK